MMDMMKLSQTIYLHKDIAKMSKISKKDLNVKGLIIYEINS